MQRIYDLLAKAGIHNAFLNLPWNLYGIDGVFDCHRDQLSTLVSYLQLHAQGGC